MRPCRARSSARHPPELHPAAERARPDPPAARVPAGDLLKDKYDGATEVIVTRRGRLRVTDRRYKRPTADDLVYIQESPDYCRKNSTLGSSGECSTSWPGARRAGRASWLE